MDNRKLNSLQGLRFLAALLVFAHHVRIFWPHGSLYNYLYYFYSGVTFFFILSGFVLTYRYAPVLEKLKGFSFGRFYRKRLATIYPLHILALIMSLVVIDLSAVSWKALIAQLFLVQTFTGDPTIFFSFNSLSWFLSDMMFLYLIFPPLLSLLFRIKRTARRILLTAILTLAYALGYITVTSVFLIRDPVQDYYLFYFSPWARITDFLTGITLGLIFLSAAGGKRLGYRLVTVAELLLPASVFVFMFYTASVPDLFRWDLYFIPVYSLIIFLFAGQQGMLSELLSHPYLVYLGKLSFPFIMFQWVIIAYISHNGPDLSPLLSAVVSFVITLVFSVAYVGVVTAISDKPHRFFNKLRLKYFNRNDIVDI